MTTTRVTHLCGLTAIGTLLCFFAASGPHAYDTGELVAAAFTLGGSHPPGQALHAILAFAATLVPLGPATFRVTLVSVAGAVAVTAIAGVLALRMARALAPRELSKTVVVVLPLAVGFATIVSPPLLRQATRPEVYTVALALFAVAVLALVWSRESSGARVASFVAGLAACLHPPHALAAIGVLGLFLIFARRDLLSRPRVIGSCALFFLLGLAPLVYLPIRSRAGAEMWGDPTTLSGFWDYISARAYRQNLGSAGGSLVDQVATVLRYLPYAAGIVPLFGLLALGRRSRSAEPRERNLVLFAISSIAASLIAALVTPIDERVPDMVAYAGPVVFLLVVLGGAGLAILPRARYALLGLVGVALSILAIRDAPAALDAEAPVLDALGRSYVATPPPRSLVVLKQDFSASTWLMERGTADARPDVAVFVSGLASSSWHWDSLTGHPAYDGEPVAGPGEDPWVRYTRGAMQSFGGEVPILVEMDEHSGGSGTLTGPYLLGDTRIVQARLPRSIGERLAPAIAADARQSTPGDHGMVHAIYRDYEARRARRLARRREPALAARSSVWALIHPDQTEETLLASMTTPPAGARMAPIVPGDESVGIGRDEAVRRGAVLLAFSGASDEAMALLDHESPHDPRALLQAGWIALIDGRATAAREALTAFDARAPELHHEADALRHELMR